jgi:hypothetical protein
MAEEEPTRKQYDRYMAMDPLHRAQVVGARIYQLQRAEKRLASIRAKALEQLRAEGWSLDRIAK